MLLPPGQKIHSDLSTSFTDFDQLLGSLRENRFSGYLRINFWGYEGILIYDNGRLIQAQQNEKNKPVVGESAVIGIMAKAGEKDGNIDVHALPNEVATVLAGVAGALFKAKVETGSMEELQEYFQDIETKNITGFVEIHFAEDKGEATVYLLEGIPVETVILSNTGKMVYGEDVFDKVLEISRFIPSVNQLYEAAGAKPINEGETLVIPHHYTSRLKFWNSMISAVEKEINHSLESPQFIELWKEARQELTPLLPVLDPSENVFNWNGNHLQVNRIFSLRDFEHGLISNIRLTVKKSKAIAKKAPDPAAIRESLKSEGLYNKAAEILINSLFNN
ncbi:MAG: hypothetical protein WAN36_14200 [Calditrichia bacterium]